MDVSARPESSATAVLDGLDVDAGKGRRGKGTPGSRENPEILSNVPGHVIPILADEFDDFTSEAGSFLAGEREEGTFIPFRLKQGVYGQRQPDVQMIRVKLPFGGVSPAQLDAFADAIEKWVPMRKGHITTRQNIQLHHVPLDDAAKLIRRLGEAGLSSREGCGNTVRNVTADPYAGVATDEVFDPTPYAGAYVRYFVRHPDTQAMPRKWKTAFSASPADRAIVPIHDIGFLPVIRDGERGFEVWVGGGTAIMPRLAHKIFDLKPDTVRKYDWQASPGNSTTSPSPITCCHGSTPTRSRSRTRWPSRTLWSAPPSRAATTSSRWPTSRPSRSSADSTP